MMNSKEVLKLVIDKPYECADCINYLKINKEYPKMLDYDRYCSTIKYKLFKEEFELLKEKLENDK